ncbi:MAG: hypothetical protein AAF192_10035 [Pseudomonadota bacterium]
MSAKTVSAPGLFGDLGGFSDVWLLDGQMHASLLTLVLASALVGVLARKI